MKEIHAVLLVVQVRLCFSWKLIVDYCYMQCTHTWRTSLLTISNDRNRVTELLIRCWCLSVTDILVSNLKAASCSSELTGEISINSKTWGMYTCKKDELNHLKTKKTKSHLIQTLNWNWNFRDKHCEEKHLLWCTFSCSWFLRFMLRLFNAFKVCSLASAEVSLRNPAIMWRPPNSRMRSWCKKCKNDLKWTWGKQFWEAKWESVFSTNIQICQYQCAYLIYCESSAITQCNKHLRPLWGIRTALQKGEKHTYVSRLQVIWRFL